MMSFEGKVAIVTGAGSGLGRSYAQLLARLGAKVLANDPGVSVDGDSQGQPSAEVVVEAIRASGGTAVPDRHSVAEPESAAEIVAAARKAFGTVDILINNAGILKDRTFAKVDLAEFSRIVGVHYFGSVYVTHAAFPIMRAQKFGRIIMTSSVAGLYGNFGQSAYGSAKLAVVGLMRTLALEGAPYNVLCNAVAPLAATRMAGNLYEGRTQQYSPDHVAAAVAFLSSANCSVNGQVLMAAAGHFALLHQYETRGVHLDPGRTLSIEDIESHWPMIADRSGSIQVSTVPQSVAKADGGARDESAQ